MKNVTLLLSTVLVSSTAVILTALTSTKVGNVVLAVISAWIATHIFGLDLSVESVKNNPWAWMEGIF